jgi:RND family efflux transporter MFP subunit
MEKGSRPQEIQIAEANVEEAEAALFEAEKTFKRVKQLHGIQAISGSEFDAAERQVGMAKARMESAKQRLMLALQGPRIEDIQTARANLRQAEAGLALKKDLLKKSMIHAPCSGIVAFRKVEQGEIVPPGTPLTQIIDLRQIKVQVPIGEKDIHVLREKERFDFTVDAIPGEIFSCTLLFLSPTADPVTRSFPAEFAVHDPDPRMADGMTVRVELPAVAHGTKIKIPSAWLAEEAGKTGIYLVDDGKAVFREVTLGAYYDNRVEILSGLKEEEKIVINPSGLTSGDIVHYETN